MIAGLGIDMVSVSRLAEKIQKGNGFKETVFTAGEIAYCEAAAETMRHYAARFAAKEAFLKATGKGLAYDLEKLKHIEVVHDEEGKPRVVLGSYFANPAWHSIHLSLSHEGDHAIAIIILEQ